MVYQIDWYQEDLVVLAVLSGDLAIEDFPIMDKMLLLHIEASPRPLVHILVNLKAVNTFPISVGAIQKALTHIKHPRTGWTVLITENRFLRFVGYTITQVSKARFRAFSEEAEALQFLQTMETDLKSTRQV
jgi:hypothetical protein